MATIKWLKADREQPKDQWGLPKYTDRERRYSVWADLTEHYPSWAERNGTGDCVLAGPYLTEHEANFLIDRLYEVYGECAPLGISRDD